MLDETHLAAVLAAKGHKLTQPRRAVLKVIAASEASHTGRYLMRVLGKGRPASNTDRAVDAHHHA